MITPDQALVLPDLTDNRNVPLSFSDFATGVESRLVKRYASRSDRAVRNPTPTEGEYSYLLDENIFEYYTGAAWASTVVTPYSSIQTLSGSVASVTFSSIPSTLRTLIFRWIVRGDAAVINQLINIRVNGDASNNYFWNETNVTNVTTGNTVGNGTSSGSIGHMMAGSAGAGQFAIGTVTFIGWDAPHAKLNYRFEYYAFDTVANSFHGSGGGLYNVAGPYTSVTFLPAAGNFVTTSQFTAVSEVI